MGHAGNRPACSARIAGRPFPYLSPCEVRNSFCAPVTSQSTPNLLPLPPWPPTLHVPGRGAGRGRAGERAPLHLSRGNCTSSTLCCLGPSGCVRTDPASHQGCPALISCEQHSTHTGSTLLESSRIACSDVPRSTGRNKFKGHATAEAVLPPCTTVRRSVRRRQEGRSIVHP